MKRILLVLVGLVLLSASGADSANKFNAKKEQAYKARLAQFVAAKAKQSAKNPAVRVSPSPLAKAQ